MERKIWKIRHMPDGTWVNVYDEEVKMDPNVFYEIEKGGIARDLDRSTTKRTLQAKLKEFNELAELHAELIDLAMQAKGMSEAHDLINRIKNDGPRDPNSV